MFGLSLTIVLALAASAVATGYIDGREYVYQYKGVIYTGFPTIKSQESGYAYNVQLRIQPEGDHAIFQVDHANRASFNGEFEDITHTHHEYKDLPAHAEFLTRPFRVYRKEGIVTHFEVTRDEPSFSVNLKRGIAALFSLNFDPSGPSTEENDIHKADPDAHYYRVYEDTLLGECETAYVIEHHPYDVAHNIVLNVTKVRNFHKCNTRPNQVYSTFYGFPCAEAEDQKPHTLHGNAQYQYSIRGDRHHYVIEKIQTESDIAYAPYWVEGQRVATTIKRSLELIEEKPVESPIPLSGDLVNFDSLTYDFDFQRDFKEPVDLKKPHYLYHLTGRKVPISDIRNQVEELVHAYDDETYAERIRDREMPAKFVELLRSVATLGYDEIEDLYNTYADIPATGATDEQKRYRNLFVDTLVNLGTNPAFLFGKHLLETKKFRPQEAQLFVQQIQFHIKEVSETLLDTMQELCSHESVKKNPTLLVACVNTLSNVVWEHCVAGYHPEGLLGGKNTCTVEASTKYFNYVARLFEQATNEKLKFSFMKVLSNFGVKELVQYVEPYIYGRAGGNLPSTFRDASILTLKNFGHKYPEKVRAIIMPMIFNQTEHFRHRIEAFGLIMQYEPDAYELESMMRAMRTDPDDQMRAFVYTTLVTIANSTNICDRRLSKNCKLALRTVDDMKEEFDHYDYTYSSHKYTAGWDHHYDLGGATRSFWISNEQGYFPRTGWIGFEDYIGGKFMATFAAGWKQQGLDKVLNKIFGPEGTFGTRSVFDLFKKRGKRDVSGVQKELNEIKAKLNLPVYEDPPINGEFWYKYMANHVSFFRFDEKTFEQFFKDGRFVIPNIPATYQKMTAYTYQKFTLAVDKFYVLPCESGIPIFFDYKQPFYYYHKNKESSLRVEPGFFPEDRGGQYPDHVIAETDGHFAIDKQMIAYTGAIIPFDQVTFGGGVNRRATVSLPLKLKLDLVVKEKKLKTHWTPVAPHEIYHTKYEPFTFIDSYANTIPQVLEKGYLPVRREHRHEMEKHLMHDALGMGFDVKVEHENEFNDFGSWVDFFLQKNWRDKIYYLYANPNFEPFNVDVKFTKADEHVTTEVETDISYHFYDENWMNPHFAEENFEDFDRQKENRGPLCTCALKFNAVAHGDKERKIHAVASWTRDLLRTFHKVNFYYDRSPFTSDETEDLKICGSSYLKYPRVNLQKMATLDTKDLDATVNTELKMHFGKNCNADQKLKIQGLISKTDEQRDFENRREEPDTPEHYNAYSHYYHECLKERERGINYGKHCLEYLDLVSTLHKYTYHIKYENLSPRVQNMTYLLDRILKYRYYTHSDHNEIDVHNPVGEVHLEANFSSKLPVVDVRVQKPTSNSNYYNYYVPLYTGFSWYPMFEDAHIKDTFSDYYCSIEGDHVFTFDKYEYTLPPIDCYKVVAKDCSPHEYFTVLASKINHPKYHKAVKVFLGDHKIEALPVSDDSDIIVRVDGQRVPIANYEPYLQREEGHSEPLFYVTYRDFYYALHSEKYGLIVEYDGHAVVVQVSPMYRGKMCGLCGNYNGLKYDGATTGNGCHYADEKDYAYSYSIPSDTCSVPRPEPICPGEGGFECTRLRTQVIQLTTGKVPQTCFSTEPVSECTAHCEASGTHSREVHYHCLPAKDDSTKALLREQEKRVLHELARKSRDHETTVEVPDRCYSKH